MRAKLLTSEADDVLQATYSGKTTHIYRMSRRECARLRENVP